MKPLSYAPFMIFEADSDTIAQSDHIGLSLAATPGHKVHSYVELLEKVAALNYYNSRFRLLFRGQSDDYRLSIDGGSGGRGILYPSILRPKPGMPRDILLDSRFKRLWSAEKLLVEKLDNPDVRSFRVVRWAILQHYEICETPLLDVSLSLQSALSFSFGQSGLQEGYLFVLAIPHLSGPVTVSTESMTQAIDLAQICPPNALRPHFQSGILLGDYPEYADRLETHNGAGFVENDFACRLLTKLHLCNLQNWSAEGFIPTDQKLLFPNDRDSWFETLRGVKNELDKVHPPIS